MQIRIRTLSGAALETVQRAAHAFTKDNVKTATIEVTEPSLDHYNIGSV